MFTIREIYIESQSLEATLENRIKIHVIVKYQSCLN